MLNNKTLLKILSVLIALGMWIMVVSGHEETKEMTVPVKLIMYLMVRLQLQIIQMFL